MTGLAGRSPVSLGRARLCGRACGGLGFPEATACAPHACARRLGACTGGGLSEDETQFLVCLLGEHLNEEQVQAIFSSLDFAERPLLPFEPDVAKILKFMNPLLHRRDVKQLGSIKENEPVKEEDDIMAAFFEEDEDEGPVNPIDWAAAQVSRAIQSIEERRRERKEREEAEIARKQRKAEHFTSWFDAMGNNQLKMATALAEHDTHFG